MSDLKNKAKEKIDVIAAAAKQASAKVVDATKDVAHSTGKNMVKQGKRLQNA